MNDPMDPEEPYLLGQYQLAKKLAAVEMHLPYLHVQILECQCQDGATRVATGRYLKEYGNCALLKAKAKPKAAIKKSDAIAKSFDKIGKESKIKFKPLAVKKAPCAAGVVAPIPAAVDPVVEPDPDGLDGGVEDIGIEIPDLLAEFEDEFVARLEKMLAAGKKAKGKKPDDSSDDESEVEDEVHTGPGFGGGGGAEAVGPHHAKEFEKMKATDFVLLKAILGDKYP